MRNEKWWYPDTSDGSTVKSYPKLPDWTKDFTYIVLYKYYNGNVAVLGFNSYYIKEYSNATYGVWYDTIASGTQSHYTDGAWGSQTSFSSLNICRHDPYDKHPGTFWANKDLPCKNDDGEEYVHHVGSEPSYFIIEYGWADGGEDDNEKLGSQTRTSYELTQGWSVAGVFRCIGETSDGDELTFEWRKDGELISTTVGAYADCKPSAKEIGTFRYYCVVTKSSGESLRTDTITVVVEEDESGDPGDGTDTEKESYVSGIILEATPQTVFTGEQVTINVTVEGMGNYSKAFVADIFGHTSLVTTLIVNDTVCTLTIGTDETADIVTVTVMAGDISEFVDIYVRYDTPERLRAAFLKGYATAKALQGVI